MSKSMNTLLDPIRTEAEGLEKQAKVLTDKAKKLRQAIKLIESANGVTNKVQVSETKEEQNA